MNNRKDKVKIDKYIADLLFVYDCVVIPGFGGFVGNYATAGIKTSQHTFTPPYKQLAFNLNLKTNDGLLAEYISRNENVTFYQATSIISQYVDALNQELKSNKKVEIEEVGVLVLDSNENLQFEQNPETNFLLDSFGLTSFHSPAIKRDSLKKKFEKQFVDRPAITPESPRVKLKKSWAVYIAVPLGIFMTFALYNNNIKQNIATAYSSFNPFSVAESTYAPRVETGTEKKPEVEESDTEEEALLMPVKEESKPETRIAEPAKEAVASTTLTVEELNAAIDAKTSADTMSSKQFHIIGGCFESETNAEKLVEELKQKGFNSYVVDKKNGLSRVSFGAYTNREEALQALKSVKEKNNASAWLLVK